jgi:hypothetical protein
MPWERDYGTGNIFLAINPDRAHSWPYPTVDDFWTLILTSRWFTSMEDETITGQHRRIRINSHALWRIRNRSSSDWALKDHG